MKAVLQRVRRASVKVAGEEVSRIGSGLLVLLGVREGDDEASAAWLAGKIVGLRIFADEEGRFDRSLKDVAGEMLVVSQFTLFADTRKGRRPSFTDAARGESARGLYERFVDEVRSLGVETKTGVFGAAMEVSLVNDGPVTVILDHPHGGLD